MLLLWGVLRGSYRDILVLAVNLFLRKFRWRRVSVRLTRNKKKGEIAYSWALRKGSFGFNVSVRFLDVWKARIMTKRKQDQNALSYWGRIYFTLRQNFDPSKVQLTMKKWEGGWEERRTLNFSVVFECGNLIFFWRAKKQNALIITRSNRTGSWNSWVIVVQPMETTQYPKLYLKIFKLLSRFTNSL